MGIDTDKVKSDVYGLIAEQFLIDEGEITDILGPGDLSNWNSIGHLQLVQKLETHFNISFTVYEIMSFNTVKDICETIKEYRS